MKIWGCLVRPPARTSVHAQVAAVTLAVYVEQVCPYTNFSGLGIGIGT